MFFGAPGLRLEQLGHSSIFSSTGLSGHDPDLVYKIEQSN